MTVKSFITLYYKHITIITVPIESLVSDATIWSITLGA
jgi:hypothetical protein